MNCKCYRRWTACLFSLALGAGYSPAAEPAPPPPTATAPAAQNVSLSVTAPPKRAGWQQRLTLGPGDTINIQLFDMLDATRLDVPVGPDGRISFLQARDVMAAGLTIDELRAKLDEALGKFYQSPRTIVTPGAFHSKKYFVLGAVGIRGVYTFDRPVTVIAPEGRVVNAKFPSPVVSGNTETSERIVDIIIAAMGRVMPEKVTGSDSGTCTAHIAGGTDPRSGEYYAWYIGSDPTAWGARATKDGFQAAGGPRIGGSVSQVPMETFETRFPYIVTEYAYQTDSGGPGKFRGGISGVTVMKPYGHEVIMGGACDRCFIPPYGIFGGMPGKHGDMYVERANGERVPLNRTGGVVVNDGDTVYFKDPGGGGYGSPLERDLDYLQHDIDNEYVSVEAAERDYGAVVDATTRQIDRPATEEKRAKLKVEWKREEIYVDQASLPYARTPFRVVKMTDQL